MKAWFRVHLGSLVCAAALAACARGGGLSHPRQILGEDDREAPSSVDLAAKIGQLRAGETRCTAFATGPAEVTTAAHCVPAGIRATPEVIRYVAGDGTEYAVTAVARVDLKKDLLLLSLEREQPAWLELRSIAEDAVSLVGIDPDTGRLLEHEGCRFERRIAEAGVFVHSCDTVAGFSGAPVLQGGRVVGIHLGYVEDLDRNVALDVASLDDPAADTAKIGLGFDSEGNHTRCHTRGTHQRCHSRGEPTPPPTPDPTKTRINFCGRQYAVSVALAASCFGALSLAKDGCIVEAAGQPVFQESGICSSALLTAASICQWAYSTTKEAVRNCAP